MSMDLDRARRALSDHSAFDRAAASYDVTTTPFSASVTLTSEDAHITYTVYMTVPTIDAVVKNDDVAPVVQTGWYETFERRLEDVWGVTQSDDPTITASLDEPTGEVKVTARFSTDSPERGPADAKAIVDFVEGTYLEGIIPGYTYTDPVSTLLNRAKRQSSNTDDQSP